jgi:small subunit ribosomal protein S1
MSWTRKVRHPSKVVSVGEEVEAVVLDIKPDNRRISLGMKQVEAQSLGRHQREIPGGHHHRGQDQEHHRFRLLSASTKGIDGWCIFPIFPGPNGSSTPPKFTKRAMVQAIVLDIEKATSGSPWASSSFNPIPGKPLPSVYEVGKEITGTITNLTDFGIFVELEEGHRGPGARFRNQQGKDQDPGGHVQCRRCDHRRVMNINSDERRIGLSIKRLEMEDDQTLLSEYVNNMKPATSTFG